MNPTAEGFLSGVSVQLYHLTYCRLAYELAVDQRSPQRTGR